MGKPVDPTLAEPLAILAERDRDIAQAVDLCGLPPRRRGALGFPGLLKIIVSQQVSTASAAAILRKLRETLPRTTPQAFLSLGEAELKAAGFSRAKMHYCRALAEDILAGHIKLYDLHEMADDAAVSHLSTAQGIGRWTAEIYLLFSLRRPDIMPAGDLALQTAAQRMKGLDARPNEKALRALAEAWRPYRSAAARFLWHAYRHPGLPEV